MRQSELTSPSSHELLNDFPRGMDTYHLEAIGSAIFEAMDRFGANRHYISRHGVQFLAIGMEISASPLITTHVSL